MLKSLLLLSVFLVYTASANNVLASYPKQLNYAPIPQSLNTVCRLAYDHSGDEHPHQSSDGNSDGNSDSHSDGHSGSHSDGHSDSRSDGHSDSHSDDHREEPSPPDTGPRW